MLWRLAASLRRGGAARGFRLPHGSRLPLEFRLPRASVAAAARWLLAAAALTLLFSAARGFDMPREPTFQSPEATYTTSRPVDLWLFLPFGYLLSVAVETPVLLAGLSKRLSFRRRLFAGLWLTACTYPIVVLVLPRLFSTLPRSAYLLAAETFAPVAECLLFWLAFRGRAGASAGDWARDFAVIVLANLLSFGAGEVLNANRWFGLF
ncbi:MAG: hypothetical protein M3379_15545 [Acidobacteriota bacterium]|nr:hypothetical protein [Acidobacteriota bacterium]